MIPARQVKWIARTSTTAHCLLTNAAAQNLVRTITDVICLVEYIDKNAVFITITKECDICWYDFMVFLVVAE